MVKKTIIALVILVSLSYLCLYKFLPSINFYNNNQIQYLFDFDGAYYDKDEPYFTRERAKLMWWTDKNEVKKQTTSSKLHLIDESENLLVFSREVENYVETQNYVTCYFNKNGKLYSVKESIRSNPSYYQNQRSSNMGFIYLEAFFFEDEGYVYTFGNMPKVQYGSIVRQIYWTDKFGQTHKKTIDDFSLSTIRDAIGYSEEKKFTDDVFNALLFDNNLVLRSLYHFNSVNIEYIIRKDETDIVLEFILTNTKLSDQGFQYTDVIK